MENKTKKKKRLNIKKLLILLLVLYLLGYLAYVIYKEPIRNIVITGNTLVSDIDIIKTAKLESYPAIFQLNRKKISKKIASLDLVEKVKIKKDFLGFKLKIEVTESKILFINISNNKLMLSNGTYIDNDYNYEGIPTLINYAPEDILSEFTIKLGAAIDYGIINLINEIEYSPSTGEGGDTIDETRFILYMNDGNQVYTNISKCKNLGYYREIYASIKDQKGILYLDSGNYKNFSFRSFASLTDEL